MQTMFERADGAKVLFDRVEGDQTFGIVMLPNGRIFDAQPVEQILARGYWEAVPGAVLKEWDESLHPRDEHGRFGEGNGTGASQSSLPVPNWVSPNNLVSATAPHVGLSPKAKEAASRIANITRSKVETDEEGNKVTTHTATYTSKSGKEFELVVQEKVTPDGMVEGRVSGDPSGKGEQDLFSEDRFAFNTSHDGAMEYGTNRFHMDDEGGPVSQIYQIGVHTQQEGVATALLEFARATSSTPVMHATTLTDMGDAFSAVVKEWTEDLHPRDKDGRFTNGADFAGAESFVNPRDDKAVQKYLELRKIASGPGVFDGPGAEQYRADMKEYRNTPQHVIDRAKLAINLENKAENIANSVSNEEAGLTPKEIEDRVTNELQQFVNENPVAVQIPFSRLSSVLDDGLHSVYESGTRGGKRGEEYKEIRENAEAAFFGYNSENTPAEQRPVYGFVARPEGSAKWDSVGTYGNTTVILNDSVRANTTVTVDDSLETWYTYGDILPTPINNVTMDSVATARAGYFVGEDSGVPLADRPFTYVEAQIHGGVEPSDIAKVILPKEPTKAMATKLDNMGINYEVKAPSV